MTTNIVEPFVSNLGPSSNNKRPFLRLGFCLLVASLTATGCTAVKGYPKRSDNPKTELAQLERYHSATLLNDYNSKASEEERRRFRDEIVFGRLRAIDLHYDTFRRALAGQNVALNLGTDLAVLGLNATGTLVPAASTKAILAAISGGLVGAKGTIDKDVFYDKTMPALFAKMDSLRKDRLVIIRTGLTNNSLQYSLLQALGDLDAYFLAGTIPGALVGITETAGAIAQKADDALKKLVSVQYTVSPIRDRVRAWLDASPEQNVPALRTWLRNRTPPVTVSPATWISDPATKDEVINNAIQQLTIP